MGQHVPEPCALRWDVLKCNQQLKIRFGGLRCVWCNLWRNLWHRGAPDSGTYDFTDRGLTGATHGAIYGAT
eukprot:4889574-Pyramimonas_sp.AAC.1